MWFLLSLGVLYLSGEWDPSLGFQREGFEGAKSSVSVKREELFHEQCILPVMKPAPDTPV